MKRVIGILMAAALSLGLLAGCGKTKMTAAEAKFREECETFTFEELIDLDNEQLQKVLVSGTVSSHHIKDKGKKAFFIDTDEDKRIVVYCDEAEEYKEGWQVNVWGSAVGIIFGSKVGVADEYVPTLKARYIEKVK